MRFLRKLAIYEFIHEIIPNPYINIHGKWSNQEPILGKPYNYISPSILKTNNNGDAVINLLPIVLDNQTDFTQYKVIFLEASWNYQSYDLP